MKPFTAGIFVIAVSLVTVAFAVAQQPSPQHGGMQPPGASAPTPRTPHDHDAQHAQHMQMCREMMGQGGGMMVPGMMGGLVMSVDPKQHAK